MKSCPTSNRTSGFTIIELLIVIAVIGILVGMLFPVVSAAFRRANEAAVQTEMAQLEMAIENFKTEYGFYPPAFDVEFRVDPAFPTPLLNDELAADRMLTFLNQIYPNHAEGVGVYPNRNVDTWWTNVGANLRDNQGADLVFWLSGLAKNQQFPLTNNGFALAAHNNSSDAIERKEWFEFKPDRLQTPTAMFSVYFQAKGPETQYRYVDYRNYGNIVVSGNPPEANAYYNNNGFFNPTSFQLATYGLDGFQGTPVAAMPPNTDPFFVVNVGSMGMDNIVSFGVGGSSGRMDTIALGD